MRATKALISGFVVQTKYGMTPVSLHLPINRAAIGAHRAAWVYQSCRSVARKFDPQFHVQGDYVGHKHVGWTFTVKDHLTAMRLRICYDAIMAGRPLPLPSP